MANNEVPVNNQDSTEIHLLPEMTTLSQGMMVAVDSEPTGTKSFNLSSALDSKANKSDLSTKADTSTVTALSNELANKVDTPAAAPVKGQVLRYNGTANEWYSLIDGMRFNSTVYPTQPINITFNTTCFGNPSDHDANSEVTSVTGVMTSADGQSTVNIQGCLLPFNLKSGYLHSWTNERGRHLDWSAINEVPTATAADAGKVLSVGQTGSISWGNPVASLMANTEQVATSATIVVDNNKLTPVRTSLAALTIKVITTDDTIPNFAVELTPTAALTLTVVSDNAGGTNYRVLGYSEAAGNQLEAGKTYQITAVGSCWTMAAFEKAVSYTTIGGRQYKTTKIGNQTWLAENLDYLFDGCTLCTQDNPMSDSGFQPRACYVNYDQSTNGQYGLLYNWYAVNYIEQNKSTLCPGWHVPTNDEWITLFKAVGIDAGQKLASTDMGNTTSSGITWTGTDDYGFSALAAGYWYAGNGFDHFGDWAGFWTISPRAPGSTNYRYWLIDQPNPDNTDSYTMAYRGYSLRLVKD